MHKNGLSRTSSKNGTWKISTVFGTASTVGTRLCRMTGKSTTLSIELDLGHVIVEELLELVAAWSQGRPNRRAAPGIAARPAALVVVVVVLRTR